MSTNCRLDTPTPAIIPGTTNIKQVATVLALKAASLLPPTEQVCIQLTAYADNVALPAFARRTPLLLSARRAAIDLYLLPAGHIAANLQQQVCCSWSMLGQTDEQTDGKTNRHTDGGTLYRYIDSAPHTMRTVPIKLRNRPLLHRAGVCPQNCLLSYREIQATIQYMVPLAHVPSLYPKRHVDRFIRYRTAHGCDQ